MFGEYGYMEEGRLGKPYNVRLLRRLIPYARPYLKTVATALLLTVAITLLDLALPYLSKVAIDRFIMGSWQRFDLTLTATPALRTLLREYDSLLTRSAQGDSGFLPQGDLKKLDPAARYVLQQAGVLKTERYYRISAAAHETPGFQPPPDAHPLPDGALFVPFAWLNGQPREDILHLRRADLRGVSLIGAVFLGLLVVSFLLGYAEHYLLEFVGQHIMQDIRMQLFERMQDRGLRFFDRQPLGRLVTRVTNDIENLNEMFKSVFITVFKDFFILTGILAVLLYLNWRLALLCFLLMPVIFGIAFLFSALAREAFRQLRATVAKINAFLQERLSGIRIVQLFAAEATQERIFERINQENYDAGMRQIRVFAVFMPIMELFASIAIALLIWRGGASVIGGELTLGALVAFISYIQMFFKPIRDISEKYNIMQSAMASTERIFEFMDLEEGVPEPHSPGSPAQTRGHIVFDAVSFGYESDRPVLQDVSFEVRPGEMVAIVGPTGAGKTTVVGLLERFYDPDAGRVLLDGVDLRQWSAKDLRKAVSPCMQDVFIFSGDLAENITLGRERVTPAAMQEAARVANAADFINRVPEGFSAQVGEGGATLSAGERQLLSFARALAGEPRVLILDEATSSVDPETEHLIQDAITRMVTRRTTLVVAHRLSTIRHADRILVMHGGRIREQGTHEELMTLRGIYYRLHQLRETVAE